MAITVRLTKAEKFDSQWKITLEFTNDGEIIIKDYRFNGTTVQHLINFAIREANNLVEVKGSDYSVLVGQAVDVVVVPPVIPEPTAEEIAKAVFLDAWELLRQMRLVVEADVGIASDDPRYIAQKGVVEGLWLDSYIGDLS